MSGMEAVAFQAASGMMKMQAARSQARGLAAQATQARVEARSEALKYKQQAVAVLDNILQTQATINARAGAGGIDPFSGSAMALTKLAQARGADEYYMSLEGGTIALAGGEAQAQQYLAQGRAGIRAATMGAVLGVGMQAYNQGTLGSEPAGGKGTFSLF